MMGIRVPLPPPRNEAEMIEQIRMLERDILVTSTMRILVVLSAIGGALVIACVRLLFG